VVWVGGWVSDERVASVVSVSERERESAASASAGHRCFPLPLSSSLSFCFPPGLPPPRIRGRATSGARPYSTQWRRPMRWARARGAWSWEGAEALRGAERPLCRRRERRGEERKKRGRTPSPTSDAIKGGRADDTRGRKGLGSASKPVIASARVGEEEGGEGGWKAEQRPLSLRRFRSQNGREGPGGRRGAGLWFWFQTCGEKISAGGGEKAGVWRRERCKRASPRTKRRGGGPRPAPPGGASASWGPKPPRGPAIPPAQQPRRLVLSSKGGAHRRGRIGKIG
jgi:hypothetical protein